MLNAEVKLVGPTITCSNPATVSVNDTMPYVQFNALATDKVSFHLLLKHVGIHTKIYFHEALLLALSMHDILGLPTQYPPEICCKISKVLAQIQACSSVAQWSCLA